MIFLILSINLALLCIEKYFKSNSVNSIYFGLSGLKSSGAFYTYSNYESKCLSELSSKAICSNLENLSIAGLILETFISIDIIVVSLYAIFSLIEYVYVRKFIAENIKLSQMSKLNLFVFTLSYKAKAIILTHCIFVNVGMGLWIAKSNVDQFSSQIVIQEGIVLVIFQCFFSLFTIASYIWEISNIKRKNFIKFKENYEQQHMKNLSGDEKSFHTCVRV